jgi:glucose/mannose-6-phosphate isomerase
MIGGVPADATGLFPSILTGESLWPQRKHALLEKLKVLLEAEICAVFLVKDDKVLLDDHIGYTYPDGTEIPFETLQKELTYKITTRDKWGKEPFDGITGFIASRIEEFSADSWDEIRRHPSYKGKPDRVGIWDKEIRPFKCMFAVPLTIGQRIVGVLKVENKREGIFDAIDKEVLRKLASLFSIAFGRADNDNMAKIIQDTPDQIEYALSDPNIPDISNRSFHKALIVGMGGSALPAEVLIDSFDNKFRGSLLISRHYDLPDIDNRTLIIASSFSGNTEETLIAIENIPVDSKNIVIITAGGKLAEHAQECGYPMIHIPKERETDSFQPRCATGYFVTYLARLLSNIGILEKPEPVLENLLKFLKNKELRSKLRSEAEEIAFWFSERIPVFYTDAKYERSIARIAKIKHNENTKRPAFYNCLPEANHNEMIGFQRPFGKFAFLYLRDPDSHPRIHLRFDIMQTVFKNKNLDHVDFNIWTMPGKTKLEKIFAALMFSDWCSYSLALHDGIDPTPVDLVEDFKKLLTSEPRKAHDPSATPLFYPRK